MTKLFSILLLITSLSHANVSSYEEQLQKESLSKLLWGVDLDTYYDQEDAQLNSSRVFFEYTPTENHFSDFFKDQSEPGDYALRFRVYLSSVPYLIEDKVFEKLETNLDAALAEIRVARTAQIQNTINTALSATPGFNQLPIAQQNAIRQNLLQQ